MAENEQVHETPAVAPLLLDTKRAAQMIGVSRSLFLSMHDSGRIPLPTRLGRRVLWRVAELEAWVEAGCPPRIRWEAMRKIRP